MEDYPKSTVMFLVEKAFLTGLTEDNITYQAVIKMNKQRRIKYIKSRMVAFIKASKKHNVQ